MLLLGWRRTIRFRCPKRHSAHAVDPEQQRAAEPAPVHARRPRFSALHRQDPKPDAFFAPHTRDGQVRLAGKRAQLAVLIVEDQLRCVTKSMTDEASVAGLGLTRTTARQRS